MDSKTLYLSLFVIILLVYIIRHNSTRVYRFYRPWCPYCKSSQPEWNKLKMSCSIRMIQIIDINLDTASDKEKMLAEGFEVRTVPSVVGVFRDGALKYEGDRKAGSYLKWIVDHA